MRHTKDMTNSKMDDLCNTFLEAQRGIGGSYLRFISVKDEEKEENS